MIRTIIKPFDVVEEIKKGSDKRLIDYLGFHAVSAVFQSYNEGLCDKKCFKNHCKLFNVTPGNISFARET